MFAHKERTNRQLWASAASVTVGHEAQSPMHVTARVNKGLRHASGLEESGIGHTNSMEIVRHTQDLMTEHRRHLEFVPLRHEQREGKTHECFLSMIYLNIISH